MGKLTGIEAQQEEAGNDRGVFQTLENWVAALGPFWAKGKGLEGPAGLGGTKETAGQEGVESRPGGH